jgi:hypothetical protein
VLLCNFIENEGKKQMSTPKSSHLPNVVVENGNRGDNGPDEHEDIHSINQALQLDHHAFTYEDPHEKKIGNTEESPGAKSVIRVTRRSAVEING